MSIYDLMMLAVMIGCIFFGLWKGLAWQVASVAAIIVSYFVALNFRYSLAPYISVSEPWNRFAAMLILFLGTSLVVWMGYGYLKQTIERWRLRGFDAQAGAILGAFKGVAVCMLVTMFAVTVFGSSVRNAVVTSRSGGYIAGAINRFHSMVPDEIHAVLDSHVQTFNNNLETQKPGFVQDSQQKLDNGFQTIRGTFRLPQSSPNNQVNAPVGNAPINNGGAFPSGGSFPTGGAGQAAGSDYTPPQVRTFGDRVFDAAKEAGRNYIDENLSR